MRLFLSSTRLPNKTEHERLFGDKTRLTVTIIPNAWDTYPEDRQQAEISETCAEFQALGHHTSILDLVTSSDQQRHASLKSSDLVWVMGGNSFYLNYQVQKNGFGALLREALANGLAYGGTSAGAIIVCPTLHGVEIVDDPHEAPQVIWEGLGLVEFGIVPHWGMEKYATKLEEVATEMQNYVPQLVKLSNEQAITVINDRWKVA